ncbi:hypothetical protein NitYY0826_C1171 [Nitratiruptor sp. YY08-26]|uniref:hypothetical protein n=1 Tax=unclassified Nitratiruptor TaxID=2624044 RepID=UPI0019164547|nr:MULTISPECIES: hypothetical protein [unclassified Nitratiruptor]BCD62295.1 hypothetical protein NitYY0813_C1169 [Nitratiruptor sp. YY08-13]BCD66231.1 hypothetical protein NitYY0826_C1171 [Nitratiruptor sp. YY08-26]
MDIEYKKAKNWENPTLQFAVNDLRLDAPFLRDLEPMQTQQISITQKIPTLGKKSSMQNWSNKKSKSFLKILRLQKIGLHLRFLKMHFFIKKQSKSKK